MVWTKKMKRGPTTRLRTRCERDGQQRLSQFSLSAPDTHMLKTRHREYPRPQPSLKPTEEEEDVPNMSSSTGEDMSEHVGSDKGRMYKRKIEAARALAVPLTSAQVTPEAMEQRPGALWFDGTLARPLRLFSAWAI